MTKYNLRDPYSKKFISKTDYIQKYGSLDNTPQVTRQPKPRLPKPRETYRDIETGRFISKQEYTLRQERHNQSFRQRLARGETTGGVTVRGEGNQYSIFVKAVSKDGYTTYHEIIQNSVNLNEAGKELIKEKARERYNHHGKIRLIPLHTINRATGEVIRGDKLRVGI